LAYLSYKKLDILSKNTSVVMYKVSHITMPGDIKRHRSAADLSTSSFYGNKNGIIR